jgi:UDP-N-acetylmuramate dehydrogenase
MSAMSPATPAALTDGLDALVEFDAPLGGHTWFGAGGRADALVRPRSEAALAELARRCRHSQVPLRILGAGANLLVLEEGVDGVVAKLDEPAFNRFEMNADGQPGAVLAWAGADLFKLLNACVRAGLDGLCPMAGIPGTVGGATRMNAGGKFGCFGDAVHSVATMNEHGDVAVHARSTIEFSYRHCSLPQEVILWTRLQLTPADPDAVRQTKHEINEYKLASQPMKAQSAGCMFRNPVDASGARVSAGKLIDQAGLKGSAHGSAFVSDEHGNFICIRKGGRADDALALARHIQQRVREHHGVDLEMEVVVWGRGQSAKEPR